MNNPTRSIRAPSTIIKSSKPRVYNGPLAQNKFKLLGSLNSNPPERSATTQTTDNPQSPTTITASSVSRIPSKPSSLIKPTPVRHIISAASTTSSIRQPLQRPLSSSKPSSSGSKLTELRIQSARSASARKSTALNNIANPSNTQVQQKQSQQIKQPTHYDTVTSSASSSSLFDATFLNSVSGDVGAIRQLLEQLLGIIQSSSQETEDIQAINVALAAELEQLRRENAELRRKVHAIKSTVRDSIIPEESETHRTTIDNGRPTNSDLFFTPMH